MSLNDYIQIGIYLLVLLLAVKPLGIYMARIYEGSPTGLNVWFAPVERWIYRLCGVKSEQGMSWKVYAFALMLFNILGLLVVYAIQRFQAGLPLNPMAMAAVSPDSSFNTAVSFATNTNWQGYGGESTMSYLTQMLALGVQNFLSAATGMVVAIALIRGFIQKQTNTIGNFWVDLVRTVLYILLPLALVLALVLVSQGMPQTFNKSAVATLVQASKDSNGKPVTEQNLALGPVASQIAIKQLGTNGGGYYNANSAHPYENPTPLSNFLEMLSLILIGGALCYTFGYMVRDRRQGWAILAAMLIIFIPCLLIVGNMEQGGNPLFKNLAVDQNATDSQPGGNMEGKEARFGIASSAIWAVATTSASNGSVNSMHDSYTPIGGMIPMWLLQLGEIIFGGVGSGLYGMIAFIIVAVFIAGLMIGRTPEYLGKKIEAFEMKMVSIAVLITPLLILAGTSLAVMMAQGQAGIFNPGAHGFSEVLYAFSSAANNNGSAFAGISVNNPFYNILLSLAMWFGRFWWMIPIIAIAGSLAQKKRLAVSGGTLPTHGPLFITLLLGVIILLGALTYLPALALGPIVEQIMMVTH